MESLYTLTTNGMVTVYYIIEKKKLANIFLYNFVLNP